MNLIFLIRQKSAISGSQNNERKSFPKNNEHEFVSYNEKNAVHGLIPHLKELFTIDMNSKMLCLNLSCKRKCGNPLKLKNSHNKFIQIKVEKEIR